MTDNCEDIVDFEDDFDIYADLDDNTNADHNFSDNELVLKTIDLIEEQNNCQNSDTRSDGKLSSNDLILSELTILEKNLNKTEDNNKCLVKQNQEFREQLELKDKQILVLKTNISSLYKTAKQEIERKKKEMNGLREELDSLIFRRLPRVQQTDQLSDQTIDGLNTRTQTPITCDKSTNTSDKDFRPNYDNKRKISEKSIKPLNESKCSQRNGRRSRSRSRGRDRHRSNGDTRDAKTSSSSGVSKRTNNDSKGRRSGSKSRTDPKRHKSVKQSERK